MQQWKRQRAEELAQDRVSMPDWGSVEFLGMNDAEMTLRSEEAVLDEPQPSASSTMH